MNTSLEMIITNFVGQFNSRILTRANAQTFSAVLNVEKRDNVLVFKMTRDNVQHVLNIPEPFVRNNVQLVCVNGIERAVSKYYWKIHNRLISYADVMYEILFGYPVHILPEHMLKGNTSVMQQLRFAYENNKLAVVIRNIQKKINHIVNNLPVHETDMNSFIMNHRITIFDIAFDVLTDPEQQHAYQVEKNKLFFNNGWTSLGLSDGCLADKNYMLSYDLRKLTPFGNKFHNPQRNLYSTLGMQGDDTPLVHSEETFRLQSQGLTRKGWNLFTIFVDIPDVWEDQLMVDIRHANKFIKYEKRCICYGEPLVKEGDSIATDDSLYVNKAGEIKVFDVQCDEAHVKSIEKTEENIGGIMFLVYIVTIEYKRFLKDGTKLTNLAANKGVIRMRDLGYAINPVTGKQQPIDVIVSAKAVLKRKNYTQVLEAILNNVNDNKVVVVPDNVNIDEKVIETALRTAKFNEDGTWICNTYVGKFKCVAGNVFWGVTHDADDTTWRPGTTLVKNGRGLREAGLKFSTIEFRALTTRFGADNAIENEILMYSQGYEDVKEMLTILELQTKQADPKLNVLNVSDVKPLRQENGIMLNAEELIGSIVDPAMDESGFMLKLPVKYQTVLDVEGNTLASGFPCEVGDELLGKRVDKIVVVDSLYVPHFNLRQCWKHDINRLGLNDVGNALNTVVVMAHNYMLEVNNVTTSMLYKAISTYFNTIAAKLSTKRGELSVHTMAVRYPHSVKGVATLSNVLPKNTVEIHRGMATELGVVDGDIVLVERFPCLGFMSLRPQKIQITDDPMCRFTIRVSGNSLGSLSLDFDGDVIYLAAFFSREAKAALKKEFETPNKFCIQHIENFNKKMGTPRFLEMSLRDYNVTPFEALTAESHAEIVGKLTGVKSNTGPVVALAYNLLRIMENSPVAGDQKLESDIEVFVDTVANSVFKQKHGVSSLHQLVTDAICRADVEALTAEGFDLNTAKIICEQINQKAAEIGVDNVVAHHEKVKKEGGSNIINKIVRKQNVLYFTSRASLGGCRIVRNLANAQAVDIPSKLFKKIASISDSLTKEDRGFLKSIDKSEDLLRCAELFRGINKL